MATSFDKLKPEDKEALQAMSQTFSNPLSAIIAHSGNKLFHEDKTQIEKDALYTHLRETAKENPSLISQPDQFSGYTPIIQAAGSLEATKILVENGADINHQSKMDGMSPIENAITVGRKDVTQYLIDNGAKINMKNANGDNLLHTIANNHRENAGNDRDLFEITESLLTKKKININQLNKDGKTALDIAREKGANTIVGLLSENGGKTAQEVKESNPLNKIVDLVKNVINKVTSFVSSIFNSNEKPLEVSFENQKHNSKQNAPQPESNMQNSKSASKQYNASPGDLGNISPTNASSGVVKSNVRHP